MEKQCGASAAVVFAGGWGGVWHSLSPGAGKAGKGGIGKERK